MEITREQLEKAWNEQHQAEAKQKILQQQMADALALKKSNSYGQYSNYGSGWRSPMAALNDMYNRHKGQKQLDKIYPQAEAALATGKRGDNLFKLYQEQQAAARATARGSGAGEKPTAKEVDSMRYGMNVVKQMQEYRRKYADLSTSEKKQLGEGIGKFITAVVESGIVGNYTNLLRGSAYSPKIQNLFSLGAKIQQEITKAATGLQVTKYELTERNNWSPFVGGIENPQRLERLADIERELREGMITQNRIRKGAFNEVVGDLYQTQDGTEVRTMDALDKHYGVPDPTVTDDRPTIDEGTTFEDYDLDAMSDEELEALLVQLEGTPPEPPEPSEPPPPRLTRGERKQNRLNRAVAQPPAQIHGQPMMAQEPPPQSPMTGGKFSGF